MKFGAIIFAAFLMLCMPACAKQDEIDAAYPQAAAHVSTPYTSYKDCIRLYKLPPEKLFYLALSSVNANKFEILEMQSRTGYILLKVHDKELLLDVLQKDKNFSYLKLTPADNNYYFSPTISQKLFNYIDLNFNAEVKELKF